MLMKISNWNILNDSETDNQYTNYIYVRMSKGVLPEACVAEISAPGHFIPGC